MTGHANYLCFLTVNNKDLTGVLRMGVPSYIQIKHFTYLWMSLFVDNIKPLGNALGLMLLISFPGTCGSYQC